MALLKAGCHFGEIALLTEFPRTATVTSKNYCTVAILQCLYFKSLIKKFPQTEELLWDEMKQYDDKLLLFLKGMLNYVPYFKPINPQNLHDILYSMKPDSFKEGQYIIKPGDLCDNIYFIVSGKLEVSITINDIKLEHQRTVIYGKDKNACKLRSK